MIHKAAIIVGVVLLAVLFYQLGPSEILALFREIGWRFSLVVGIYGLQELVRSVAVLVCLPRDGRPPLREILRIRFVGESVRQLTLTGPVLSEPARAWLLSRHVPRSAEAFAAALAEYLGFSFVSAAMTVAAMAYLLHRFELSPSVAVSAHILLYGAAGYLSVGACALIWRVHLIGWVSRAMAALPFVGKRLKVDESEVRHMEATLLQKLRDQPWSFVRVMALSTLAHALLVLETYWVMASMKLSFPFHYPALVESVTKVVNMALFIGATEGAYAVVFESIGLAATAGFTLSLCKRLRSLAVAAVGLGGLSFTRKYSARPRFERPSVRTDR